MEYIVTTRKEKLESLKDNNNCLIGVDGTVSGCEGLYDLLFDHHKVGGADIQIHEIPESSYKWHNGNYINEIIVTTMVDADAICAAYVVMCRLYDIEISTDDWELLEAISYDCDHLAVPSRLSKYADKAAMIVGALKQSSNNLAAEMELPSDREYWSIDQKEVFSSAAFAEGVFLIEELLDGNWDYESLAKPYMENLAKITEEVKERVRLYNGCLLFDARGLGGEYIDPRCWLRAAESLGLSPVFPITLVTRDVVINGEWKGLSHTIGCVPFHPELPGLDFTKTMSCLALTLQGAYPLPLKKRSVFDALTEAERKVNPDCDAWGGRKTVGGERVEYLL